MSAHRFIDRETGRAISKRELVEQVTAILEDLLQAQAPETRGADSEIPPTWREGGPIPKTGGIVIVPPGLNWRYW